MDKTTIPLPLYNTYIVIFNEDCFNVCLHCNGKRCENKKRRINTMKPKKLIKKINLNKKTISNLDYNEIVNCVFNDSDGDNYDKGIYIWTAGGLPCTHNWIHNCILSRNGRVDPTCDDWGGNLYVGVYNFGNDDNYNTIEMVKAVKQCGFTDSAEFLIEVLSHINKSKSSYLGEKGLSTTISRKSNGPKLIREIVLEIDKSFKKKNYNKELLKKQRLY